MPEIKKGNNSANNVSGVTSFNLCKMAGHAKVGKKAGNTHISQDGGKYW